MEVSKKNSFDISQLHFSCGICCSPRKRPPAAITGLSLSSAIAACEEAKGEEADKGDISCEVISVTVAWLASRQAGIMRSSSISWSPRLRKAGLAGPGKAGRWVGAITSGLYQRIWHPQEGQKREKPLKTKRDYRKRAKSAYSKTYHYYSQQKKMLV